MLIMASVSGFWPSLGAWGRPQQRGDQALTLKTSGECVKQQLAYRPTAPQQGQVSAR